MPKNENPSPEFIQEHREDMGKDAPTVPRRRRGELLLINPNNQKTSPTQYAIVNSNAGYSGIPEPSHGRNT
ncbi:predicted protein [Botrytis cinerea T4]|uniref:Uncharacterized protein n=1 Tax=Botryotinia fuckeliana (strain T4) TaxID=999810 RepID=G2YCJ8_BOTF4|nr:predicted protein [Botrytis cinerea T4]